MKKGFVNSIQSLGTVDGPGIRFVVFMQGCNLRCGCCHNPDTWEIGTGTEYSPSEICDKAERYREYYKDEGGITISGGEPLLQAEFCYEVFLECKKRNINTCLDTSGCILNDDVKKLLTVTDRVLLDIKYTDDELYKKYVGCSLKKPLEFLQYLDIKGIPVTLRQVIIPTLNDNEENIKRLKSIREEYPVIEREELLPFKKICKVKYDNMGLEFPFDCFPEPSKEDMKRLSDKLIKE